MPLMIDQTTKAMELVQCRETPADAAVKWSLVVLLAAGAIGAFLAFAYPAYEEWKWRRKLRKEGMTK